MTVETTKRDLTGFQSLTRTVSVIAQDPSVKNAQGRILMSRIQIPHEDLAPGPIGYRVQVVDFDATDGRFHGSHVLPSRVDDEPLAWTSGLPEIMTDYRFHAQNVYALVMKTLARFERALGRRVGWSFRTHQLKVAPHGMLDANAFYTQSSEGLVFGYFMGLRGKAVFTCLSHDVVVHETTHALLDGLRKRYLDPSSPDQAAFHEGFSDVIALLSVFSQTELVQELLSRGRTKKSGVPRDMIHETDVTAAALKKSALFGLAEEMGREMEGVRGCALRRSATLAADPALQGLPEFLEPHRRGELLVAAVLHSFVNAWAERIKGLAPHGKQTHSLARVAEEGSDIADILVTMWIRGLDYMPPVHIEFGDALAGVLTADLAARRDDSRHRLRSHTKASFLAFGFSPPSRTTSSDGLWVLAPDGLNYDNLRFESMRTDYDEVFRFLWVNRDKLRLRSGAYTEVLSVRPCTRIGEDGFALRETVAEYYQVARLTPEEMRQAGVVPPEDWVKDLVQAHQEAKGRRDKALGEDSASESGDESADELVTPLYGGGTLIFDEFGRLKYHLHNDVFGSRQSKRLAYLYEAGMLRAGRDGGRLSAGRLSTIHRLRAMDARRFPKEGW
jgi:hypothetical protein